MFDAPLTPPAGVADGELAAIHAEYARAIQLIHRIRDGGSGDSGCGSSSGSGVRHWSLPASKISADFFCAAEHPQNGWFGFLADAAGHGLASAIFALHTPALFREAVLLGLSLPAIHERIDRFLIRQRIADYFVCGLLVHVQGREIEVINCGMPGGLLLGSDGGLRHAFAPSELPFGIDKIDGATPARYRLARGDEAALLIYSDGLSELGMTAGDALGAEGVLALAAASPATLFDDLVQRVTADAGTAHDDVSLAWIPVPRSAGGAAWTSDDIADDGKAGPRDDVADVAAALRIVEHIDRGLLLTDGEQRIIYVNPAFTEITGYSRAEVLGKTPHLLSSGRHSADFYRGMWATLNASGEWSGEIWNRRKDGSVYLEWLDIRALRDEAGGIANYLATFTVIARQELQQERLRRMALHDGLTGLANRVLLADRGTQAMRRADRAERSLAVMFIDLDRFQSINDSLGHDVGDQVLVEASRRMASVLRDDDTLSRFGSDEFVCLLSDIAQRDDAALVAGKLLAALEQPVEVAGHCFKVSASIGISAYPSDANTLDDLVVLADRAMLRAKQAGGNIFRFFSAEMAVTVARQLEMEARLAAAIRNGELELHFQPKLDLHSHEIVGAEALVRWRDPKQGLIPPGAFIPVAEKSDLIARIGTWVLEQACAALVRWDGTLPDGFRLAVNVSPMQFERSDLAEEVKRAVAASGVAASRLQLEVTESLFIRDADGVARVLADVAAQGISVALDDFGTGYSNLGSLSSLPLDTFKLDQRFVREVDRRPASSSIARVVWHLAAELDKSVIAEGIETCSECQKIQALGYRIGQGYRFGKPMAEAEFLAHMGSWRPEHCACPKTHAPS